jgi:hypothetical protein
MLPKKACPQERHRHPFSRTFSSGCEREVRKPSRMGTRFGCAPTPCFIGLTLLSLQEKPCFRLEGRTLVKARRLYYRAEELSSQDLRPFTNVRSFPPVRQAHDKPPTEESFAPFDRLTTKLRLFGGCGGEAVRLSSDEVLRPKPPNPQLGRVTS